MRYDLWRIAWIPFVYSEDKEEKNENGGGWNKNNIIKKANRLKRIYIFLYTYIYIKVYICMLSSIKKQKNCNILLDEVEGIKGWFLFISTLIYFSRILFSFSFYLPFFAFLIFLCRIIKSAIWTRNILSFVKYVSRIILFFFFVLLYYRITRDNRIKFLRIKMKIKILFDFWRRRCWSAC